MISAYHRARGSGKLSGNTRLGPLHAVWRRAPEAADGAATYVFHPRQETERLPDGALVVRFRAGGLQEMAWYLARWGDTVEVIDAHKHSRRTGN